MLTKDDVRNVVKDVLEEELKGLLKDVSWRMQSLYEGFAKVPAEGLNLKTHLATGYTVTADSPSAGSIAWTDLHIVYQGVDYGPFSGDTAMKYVWFDQDHATDKIQESNTKPTLTTDDAIIFVNEDGTPVEALKSQLVSGALLLDGTVRANELADAAVTGSKILAGAVGNTALANDAVDSAKIAAGAVTSTELTDGAVTSTKIVAGAVGTTALADDAVNNAKIATGAVGSTELTDAAVTSTKLADGSVVNGKLGSGAVAETNLADNAVTSAKIATGAVGSTEVANGALTASKLNLLAHLIF